MSPGDTSVKIDLNISGVNQIKIMFDTPNVKYAVFINLKLYLIKKILNYYIK